MANYFKKLLIGRAFTAEEGSVTTFGRIHWILFPARAMAKMIQDIGNKNGESYLYKLGYDAGKDFGNEISQALGFKLKAGRMVEEAVLSLTEFTGFGLIKIIDWDLEKNGHHLISLQVNKNPVTEHSKSLYGKKSMSCTFFRGVFAGNTELETYAKNVKFVEKRCICKGAKDCIWETKW